VVRDKVFQDAQSGHWPAHLTLCAPHSVQTYADFAFAIRNTRFYIDFIENSEERVAALRCFCAALRNLIEANDSKASGAAYYIKMPTLSH
jgi:hypothetical protein